VKRPRIRLPGLGRRSAQGPKPAGQLRRPRGAKRAEARRAEEAKRAEEAARAAGPELEELDIGAPKDVEDAGKQQEAGVPPPPPSPPPTLPPPKPPPPSDPPPPAAQPPPSPWRPAAPPQASPPDPSPPPPSPPTPPAPGGPVGDSPEKVELPGGQPEAEDLKGPAPGEKTKRGRLAALRERIRRKPAAAPAPAKTEKPEERAPEVTPDAPRMKPRADDFWFRASTRVRAAVYWVREKAQVGLGGARDGGEWVADRWSGVSRENRIRAGAVAGVVLLYVILKFLPVPGVPCGVSAVKECAPGDDAIALVPSDALIYAHVTLEEDSTQYERADEAFDQLVELERLVVGSAATAIPAPSGAPVDLRADVLPWAEDDLAVMSIPQPKAAAATAIIAGVSDRGAAEEFLTKIAPPAPPANQAQGDAPIQVWPDGFAAAFSDDELVFGGEAAVRRSLDAQAGTVDALDGADAAAARDDLPEARFAEVFLSREGVQRFLAGRPGPAAQLGSFVDYEATSGLAAAVVAREETLEVELVSTLDPKLAEASPSLFAELPRFEPDLAEEIGDRAIGYVNVGRLGPTLTELLARPGEQAAGLAASLQELAGRLEAEAGVNPLRDLLPALGGQAALVAEPTDGIPFASLIVEGVDEDAASEALARLQQPLLRSVGVSGRQIPSFEETEVDGVTVNSVTLSPTVELAYATFDGMLVISTSPAGIERVRSDGDTLADSDEYEEVTDRLPDDVSALVFLNLDELFAQVTRTGLVEDPSFADLTVLFDNAASMGLAVQGEDDEIRSKLSLTVDD
jgi:hypothetical protein